MQITLFEDALWDEFLPLVFTRPVGALRLGIFTLAEKWSLFPGISVGHATREYLQPLFPCDESSPYYVNSRLMPGTGWIEALTSLPENSTLVHNDHILLARVTPRSIPYTAEELRTLPSHPAAQPVKMLERITDLISDQAEAIRADFQHVVTHRKSADLDPSSLLIGPAQHLFIEEGARVLASTINTSDGPVYIGKNAEVMEGVHLRGPFALGENSLLKMGARIYGPVSIGPSCKVGGEVSSSSIQGYSNKAHDGFLGHSLLGEWCNLGADSNNSNLKNNYSTVKLWNYARRRQEDTGLVFCGLIMGDHSRCGINTMFNTGTVVGVNANIVGGGYGSTHVPSFSWGNGDTYQLDKALDTIEKVMARRDVSLSENMRKMLTEVYKITAPDRQLR